ncbi:transportin-3 [Atheta coriaria]|uniref:transportin-3 n=1 Tax=Dalotia coriaria TaxID=877792 RepID=UPI0031F390CB
MEQKPSLEMVYMAISTLYSNPVASEKERASQWLGDFQKSVHAWTIADEILHHKRDLESCYFAAQTMRSKIHQSFHELPLEAHASLRDSLLEHISQITEGTNSVIVTQLCLALSDLILQMPTWQRAPLDLVSSLSQSHLWPLLEVLIVLPEELESRSVRLGENRRQDVIEELKQCAPTVNEFLKHCCNQYNSSLHDNIQINVKIQRCFTSWVSLGAITLDDVVDNVVINRSLQILSYKQETEAIPPIAGVLHDAATDCICTLLQSLEDNNNQQNLESFLFSNVMTLEVPYHLSVANEDQEKSMNYCRIFTELGETFLEKILMQTNEAYKHYAIKVLDMVLICVGHHDFEVAEITFNLWYLLSEELYQKNNKTLTELFRSYVERLVTALCRHCQMEPDQEGLLEDGDDFKDFRLKVSDLVKDVVFIIGSSSCFRHMFMTLQRPEVTWDVSESALFIMQAVAKNVLPTENEVVPKVVEAILVTPENTHIAVRYTSVMLLGELCEWIEKHPEMLDPVLNFVVCCLPQAGVGGAAATALQSICAKCNEHMPRHVPVLLQLLRQVDTFAITNNAVMGLLKGVAHILSKMDSENIVNSLRELCLMQINPLMSLAEQQNVPAVRGTKTDPVLWLDRLSSIFRSLVVPAQENTINPCKPVVLEVWPVLSMVMDKYQSDVRIMERACRAVRFMLRCVSQQVKEMLESLVLQIVTIYTSHPHSCFLYLGSILVDEYGTDPTCISGLLEMLQALINPTFQLLQAENGLRHHPDTVDDFFRLCARYIQRAPIPFLRSPGIPPILECGLLACSLDHKEANTSVMKFFSDLINTGRNNRSSSDYTERKELVGSILQRYGAQLVHNLIHACVFYLHSYMFSEVGDVIVEMLNGDRDAVSGWLAEAVKSLPKQVSNGVINVTEQQMNGFHATVYKSTSSKSVTYALKDLAALYR